MYTYIHSYIYIHICTYIHVYLSAASCHTHTTQLSSGKLKKLRSFHSQTKCCAEYRLFYMALLQKRPFVVPHNTSSVNEKLLCRISTLLYGSFAKETFCCASQHFVCEWKIVVPRCIEYGEAAVSRLLKIIGLFCRISTLLYGSFAKETFNFKEPTTRSHPIPIDLNW